MILLEVERVGHLEKAATTLVLGLLPVGRPGSVGGCIWGGHSCLLLRGSIEGLPGKPVRK